MWIAVRVYTDSSPTSYVGPFDKESRATGWIKLNVDVEYQKSYSMYKLTKPRGSTPAW